MITPHLATVPVLDQPGEILCITERVRGLTSAQSALALIEQLPLKVLPINKETVPSAAHTKANFSLACAEDIVVASALSRQGCILTEDPKFQAVEGKAKIQWHIPVARHHNYILVKPAPLRYIL